MTPTVSLARSGAVAAYCVLVLVKAAHNMPISYNFIGRGDSASTKVSKEIRTYNGLFAKIPQELKHLATNGILSSSIFPQDLDLGKGCTNQIAKVLAPLKSSNDTSQLASWGTRFINLPIIIRQPIVEYNVLVAFAPKNIKIGKNKDNKPIIIYIVFPDDDVKDSKTFHLPEVYFVTKSNESLSKYKNSEPVIIMDSNRTVSGFKSAQMIKIVKLKNKLKNLFK